MYYKSLIFPDKIKKKNKENDEVQQYLSKLAHK